MRDNDIVIYNTTSSASGQDEPNLALCYVPQGTFIMLWCFINPLLTKLVRSKWLDIGLVLFLSVYGPRLRLGP